MTINTFLPMRNKFAYAWSRKILAVGFNKLLESIFCLLLVVEVFSLQKVVEMLEEVVVGWWEVWWIWWMKQNFIAQFGQSRNDTQLGMCLVVKVWCYKEQYYIETWNIGSMNQGKLDMVKQEMARVNIDILGIGELKWMRMGEFNSDDHYIYYCGQESLRRNGVALIVNKRIQNALLGLALFSPRHLICTTFW